MRHVFDCDNCGAKIETHCFDPKQYSYYTPPIPKFDSEDAKREGLSDEEAIGKILIMYATRAITTLCDNCVSLDRWDNEGGMQ